MVLGGVTYGWYTSVARYQATTNYTYNEAYVPWRYYYRIIMSANSVIDALGGNDVVLTDTEQKVIMGQAKAMRGYSYFYLSQLYTDEYGDGSKKVLPIYTSATMPNQPKSKMSDVFNLIISDLTQAVDYLDGFVRTSKDRVDQDVAKGLLSYALLARGTQADFERAADLTDEIITSGKYPLTTRGQVVANLDGDGRLLNPEAGFNNVNTPSWIWGVDITSASNLDLVSWWGQVDLFTYSYAWAGDAKVIDKGLYDKIKDEDVRKKQFGVNNKLAPINKFFAPERKIGGQRVITTDYIYMRIDEIYLLNAEANARAGREGEAIVRLKDLLSERLTDVDYVDALSGQALIDEIYLQTRIEMWGEGKTYLALKRNKASVTRGSNHIYEAGKTFLYNADELTFPIPQAEEINNPVLNQ